MRFPKINPSWTLFLDRDGVLNKKIPGGYVLNASMLEIARDVPQALLLLSKRFGRIVIITNQRGIALGLMRADDLSTVNDRLLAAITQKGGRIDAVFACPHGLEDACGCRKPKPGLVLQAKQTFPEIDFNASVLVGDSESDIQLGRALGMFTVRIGSQAEGIGGDAVCPSLFDFARSVCL